MKYRNIFLSGVLMTLCLTLTSCQIEGERICGIWNSRGEYGNMKVEITPWKGKFHGYLLEYQLGDERVKGAKTQEHIFITDLEFEENQYLNGKMHIDPNSTDFCGLSLRLMDANKLEARYDCDGQVSKEFWFREGFYDVEEIAVESNENEAPIEEDLESKIIKEEAAQSGDYSKTKTPSIEEESAQESTFHLIGLQEQVRYEDYSAIEKSLESLWQEIYDHDFSGKLDHITEPQNVYVGYSNYDDPKGKMTITLGYKVMDLSNVPAGLKGLVVPSNDYLVYLLSGTKADYEGEEWEQLWELMAYRKENTVDFEVYSFDETYNITKAEIWIATK